MLESAEVICPYCGEYFDTAVDCSAGSQHCIEDCPVCCRPVEFHIEISLNQELVSVTTRRDDE